MRRANKGFTLIEVMVTLFLLVGLVALTMTKMPVGDVLSRTNADKIMAYFAAVEVALSNYQLDKGADPVDDDADNDFLDEAELAPSYIFADRNPLQDTGFGTYGYKLDYSSSGTVGWYICAIIPTVKTGNEHAKAITRMGDGLAPSKRGWATSGCAVTTEEAFTASDQTFYFTYWISIE